jgi:hypothetical protein
VLQLICHHTYDTWGGLPIDRSAYGRSNGTASRVQFEADGATPGSGALRFEDGSQVAFAAGDAWQDLGALRVEVVAKLRLLNPIPVRPRFLVLGSGSFSLADHFPAGLEGTIRGPGGTAVSVNSQPPFSPDGHSHVTPQEQWSSLAFTYDGFSTMELHIDGVVVGRRSVNVPVPPVDAGGVSIGAGLDGHNVLAGRIDEIKIWRRDPEAMRHEFLCRPWDADAIACWMDVFGKIGAAFDRNPREMQAILQDIGRLFDAQLRIAGAAGPSAVTELAGLVQRYTTLWCRGQLDSDAMQTVFRDFIRWWRRHVGGDPGPGRENEPVILRALQRLVGPVDFRCDPAMLAMQSRIITALQAEG